MREPSDKARGDSEQLCITKQPVILSKRLLRAKDLNRDVLLPVIHALFRFFDAAGLQPIPPGLFPGAGL